MYFLYQIGLVVFALLSIAFTAKGQYSIKGKVTSSDHNEPLPWAYVFLSGTSFGTQTNSDGQFELNKLPAGTFKLAVSYVGFESVVIEVHPEELKLYNIVLKPSLNKLNEVVVSGKPIGASQRAKNMKDFRENFIGLSENADHCTIENPNAIRFKNEALILEASTDSLLIIVNEGLGYKLKFLLEKFALNTLNHFILYKGQILFEKLPARDEQQEQLWAGNRLKAYHGSELHFVRSLYKHSLAEEGFLITLYQDRKLKNGRIINEAIADTVLSIRSRLYNRKMNYPTVSHYYSILDSAKSTDSRQVLKFKGKLEVLYIHEAESLYYLRLRDPGNHGFTIPQRTRIELLKPGVAIESNGTIIAQENLPSQGYWSWELVAETLPVDYDPTEDQKLINQSLKQQ